MKYTVQDDEFLTQGAKRTSNPLSYMVILCPCDAIWQIDFFFFFLNITALHVVLFFNFWWVIPNCIKIRIYIYIHTKVPVLNQKYNESMKSHIFDGLPSSQDTQQKWDPTKWDFNLSIDNSCPSKVIQRCTTETRPNKKRIQSLYRQLLPLKSPPVVSQSL